jgi:hypothetical protein
VLLWGLPCCGESHELMRNWESLPPTRHVNVWLSASTMSKDAFVVLATATAVNSRCLSGRLCLDQHHFARLVLVSRRSSITLVSFRGCPCARLTSFYLRVKRIARSAMSAVSHQPEIAI